MITSPSSTSSTSAIRRRVSRVGFHGFASKVLINDWLRPAFAARLFMERPCFRRSSLKSFTTSAQIASRVLSLDTHLVYGKIELTPHIIKMISDAYVYPTSRFKVEKFHVFEWAQLPGDTGTGRR